LTVDEDEPFILHPGEFVLRPDAWNGIELPNDLVARLRVNRVSGRLGLLFTRLPDTSDPAGRVI
jgi:hypothetical protein